VINKSIIAFGSAGEAVWCSGTSMCTLTCSDVFGNAGGDWVGCLAGQDSVNGNFSADPLFCGAAIGDLTLDALSPCLADSVCGRIGALGQGCDATAVPEAGACLPGRFYLAANEPNPFTVATKLAYDLPTPATVTLEIYDVAGRLIRVLAHGRSKDAGRYVVTWDGRDDHGTLVASGVLFCRLEVGGFWQVRKMLLIR
jgi:hypothetical protein